MPLSSVIVALFAFFDLSALAANTPDNVTGTAPNTPLDSSGSYSGGTPGTTSDVVFTSGTLYSGTFTLNTSPLSIGTLDDLNATALTINGSQVITLNTAANSVSGTAADLLYVAGGGSLTINDSSNLVFANGGSVDDAGTLNLGTTPVFITAAKTVTFTGVGTTTIGGVIAATTGLVTVNDAGGKVVFSNTDLYTGATTINGGTLDLSTFTGSVASSAITVNAGGKLAIDSISGTPVSSVTRGASLSLAGGAIVDTGTSLGNTDDIITGALTVTGMNIPATLTVTPNASESAELSAASLAHTVNGTALVNGTNLGAATVGTAGDGNIIFTTAPTTLFVGSTTQTTGGINASQLNTAIIPFFVGEVNTTTGAGTQTGTANTFVTYDATTGLRPLALSEYSNNATVAGDNVYITSATTGTAATSINSLVINGGNLAVTGTLTDASGAILFASSNNITGGTSLTTTANSLNIYVDAGVTSTISTLISLTPTGASGVVVDLGTGSNLTLTGGMTEVTVASSGPFVINGTGTLTLNGGAYSSTYSGYGGNFYVNTGTTLNFLGGTSITAYNILHSQNGSVVDINSNAAIKFDELVNTGTGGIIKLTRSGLTLGDGNGTNFAGTITGGAGLNMSNGFTGTDSDALTGVNNYAGGTSIISSSSSTDTLKISGGSALSDTGLVTLGTTAGTGSATLDLNGFSETIGSLSNSATQANTLGTFNLTNSGAASTLTINTAVAGNAIFTGVLKAASTANLSLVKKGINTETLGGINTYTGSTTVNNGTLALDFSQFATSQTNSPFDILTNNDPLTLGGGTLSVIGNPDGAAISNGSWTGSLTSQILTFASGVPAGLTVGQAVSGTGLGGGTYYIVSINTAAKTIAINADPTTTSGTDFASTAITMSSFQGMGNLTLTAGTGSGIIVNGSTGSGGTQFQLGNTWNRGAGSTLGITLTGDTPVLTSTPTSLESNGTVISFATVTDSGGTGFATVSGGNIVRYTGATVGLPTSGSSGTDYSTSGLVNLTASEAVNSLAIDTSSTASSLILGGAGNVLTLTSGGLLMTGSNSAIITNGQLTSGTGELIVQQYGTGTLTLLSATINSGSLTKAGPGTLILIGANNYTGGTNLDGGIVNFASLTSLGTAAINFGGGTLQYATGNTDDITARTVTLAGAGGTIDTNGNIITFANAIGGTGGLAKAGSGALTLSALNTYTGDTTVQGGTLVLNLMTNTTGVVNSGSAIIGQGGTLALLGNPSVASSQTLGGLNVLSGGTGIALDGTVTAGVTLTLNNTWARTAGATVNFNLASSASNVLQSATVSNNANGIIGGWATITTTAGTGFATYSDSPSVVTNPIIALTGQATLPASGGAAATNYTTTGDTLTNTLVANSVVMNASSGPVTLALGTFNFNLGTVAIPGALLVTGTNTSSITGTGELGTTGSEVIINQYSTGALTVSTPISGGAGSLTTSGPGTVIVNGNANVYTGKTSIDGGVFLADNSSSGASATGTSAVTVANGATLGGSGFITPSSVTSSSSSTVAVNIGAGAILSPSNGTNGNNGSFASHLTFALSSGTSVNVATPGTTTVNLVFDLGSSTATSDEILISGGGSANELTMNGEQFSNFTFNQETGFGAGTYTLVQTDNANGISSNALGAGVTGTIGAYNATLQINNVGGDEDLQLVVFASIPEPRTWTLLLVGSLGLLLAFRFRRNAALGNR